METMKLASVLILTSVGVLWSAPALVSAQEADSPVVARTEALASAMNTGDPSKVYEWTVANYPDEAAREDAVGYWMGVHREVGPVTRFGVEVESAPGSSTSREIVWYRGRVTGAWVGLSLRLDEEGRWLRSGGVRRGLRPPIAPVPIAVSATLLPDSLDAYLEAVGVDGWFSGAVLVARDGVPIYEGAFGWANEAEGRPNSVETPFALASVTKMFTGVAIAQLAERGQVSLDEPVNIYVPEYPEHIGSKVTIRHLLTHSSGIELDRDPDFNAAARRAGSMEDLLTAQLAFIENLNRGNYESFEPLESFDYTNEGVDLLGIIIERVSGQTWSAYLATNVFAPAGMTKTGADFLAPSGDLAEGYTSRGAIEGTWEVAQRRLVTRGEGAVGRIRPAGTGYSTVGDMLRFMEALRAGELVAPSWADQVLSPQVEVPTPPQLRISRHYGFLVDITDTPSGHRVIGHTGGAAGMNTLVQWYPESGYTVIVLSNFDQGAWWVNQHIQELMGVSL
jgi:D-alanyl-D-alanine carboxypeptidase